MPLFLTGLFLVCLSCHGQLAEMKPPPQQLTFFYIMISAGGTLGYIMISAGGTLGSLSGSVLAPALLNVNGIIKSDEISRNRIYFPLKDKQGSLINSQTYKFIERVAPDLAAKITREKKLWGLNQLDIMDKHRLLVPTITQSEYRTIAIREDEEDDPPMAPAGAIFMLPGITTADGTIIQVAREPRIGTRAYFHNQRNGFRSKR